MRFPALALLSLVVTMSSAGASSSLSSAELSEPLRSCETVVSIVSVSMRSADMMVVLAVSFATSATV
jgi:hypothetical protein